jgi:hypothetical protein
VDGVRKLIRAGDSVKIKGGESFIITRVMANTFFNSYLGVDVVASASPMT